MGMMESIEKDPIVAFYLKMSKSTQMLGRLPIYSETILRLAFKQILNKFRVLETAEIHLYCKLLQLYYFDCYGDMDSMLMIFPHHSEEEIYDCVAEAETILAEWRLFTKNNLHIVAYKQAYMEILSEWCLRYVSVFRQVDKDALAWKTCELQSFLNSDIKFQKTWLRTLQNVIKTKDGWNRGDCGEEGVTEEHLKICNIYRDIKTRLHPWVVENCARRRERPAKKATAFLVAPDYTDGGAASSTATVVISDDESLYEAPPPKHRAATRPRQRTTNKRNHAAMLNEQPPAAEGYVMYGEVNGEAEAEADAYVYAEAVAAPAQDDFIPLNKKAKVDDETESAERMPATTTTTPNYDYWERGYNVPKRKKYNSNSCSSTSSSNKTKSGQNHHPVDGEKTATRASEAAIQKQQQQGQQKLKQQQLQKLKEQQKLREQQLHKLKQQQKLKQLQQQQQKLIQQQLKKQQAQAKPSPPPIVLNNLIRKQGIRSGRMPPTPDTVCMVSSSSSPPFPYSNNNEHEVRRKPDRGHLPNNVNDIKKNAADGREDMLTDADEDVGQGSYRSVPHKEHRHDSVDDDEELDEEDSPQTETETDSESESEVDEEDEEEKQKDVRKIHIEYEDDTLDEQEEDEEEIQEQEDGEEEIQEQEDGEEEIQEQEDGEEETQDREEGEEDAQEREDDEEEMQQQDEESADEEDDTLDLEEAVPHEQEESAEELEEDHEEEILIEAELEESPDDETEADEDAYDELVPEEIIDVGDESNDEQQEVASRATTDSGHSESFDEGHEEILEEVEIDERRVGEAGEILPETDETHEEATEVHKEIVESLEDSSDSFDKAALRLHDAAGSLVDAAESLDEVVESLDGADEVTGTRDEEDETLADDEHTLVIDEDAPMIDDEDTAVNGDETSRVTGNLTASSERDAGDQVEVLTIVDESDMDYKPIEIEVVEPEEAADEEPYDIEYQSGSCDQVDVRNEKVCLSEDVEMKEPMESAIGGDCCENADFDEEDRQSQPEDTYEDVEYLFECLPDESMNPQVKEAAPVFTQSYICVAGMNICAQIADHRKPLASKHMLAIEQPAFAETEKTDFTKISVAEDDHIFMDEEIIYEEESVVAEEESVVAEEGSVVAEEESIVQQIVASELLEASPEEEQTIGEPEIGTMEMEDVEEPETVIRHEHVDEQESVVQDEVLEEQEFVVHHEHEELETVVEHEHEEQETTVQHVHEREHVAERETVIRHEHVEEQESVVHDEVVEEQEFVVHHEHVEQETVIQHEDVEEQISALHHEDVEEQQTVVEYETIVQQETDGQHGSVDQLRAAAQKQLAEHEPPVAQQETVVEEAASEATEQGAFVEILQAVTQQDSEVMKQEQPTVAGQTEANPEDCCSTFTREGIVEWKVGEMYKFVEGCMGLLKVFEGTRKEALEEVAPDTAVKECVDEKVPPEAITAVEQEQLVDEAAQSMASPEDPATETTDDCVMYDRDVDVVNEVVVCGAKPDDEETLATTEVDRLASGITINVDYSPMIEECFDADPPKASDTLLHEPFAELAAFRPVDHVDHQYVMQQQQHQQQYSQKKRVSEPLHSRLLNISDYDDLEPSHRCLQIELDLLQVRIDEATQAIEAQSSSEDSNGGDSEKHGGATTTTTATSNPSPDHSNESPGSQQCGDNSNDSRLHEPMSVDPMDMDPSASSSPQLEVHIYNEATTTPPSGSKEEIDSNDSGGAGGGGGGGVGGVGSQTHLFNAATSPHCSLSQGDMAEPVSAAREDDKSPTPSPEAAMAALFHPDGVNEDDSDKHVAAGISDTPPSSSGSLHEPSKMELSLDFLIGEPKFDAESLLAGGGSLSGSKRNDCISRANDMLFGLGTLSTISAPHVYTSLHTTSTSTGTSTTTVMPLIPYFPALDSPATSPVSVAASATMQQVAPSQLSLMTSSYDDLEPTAELPVVSYEPGETLQPMDVDELSVTKNVLSEGKIIKKISHALAAKYVFQLRAYAIDNGHYAAMKLLDQIDRMFQGTY